MDRRFCFEVITPTTRRIYQALSEEDVTSWIGAISKSIESLINGFATPARSASLTDLCLRRTSSVRHFDAARLTGTSTPYSLNDFASTTSLNRHIGSSSESPTIPHSPSGGLSQLSNRLPAWMAPPLSRRASLGSSPRKGMKEKCSTDESQPPRIVLPSLAEHVDVPRRRTHSRVSEGSRSSESITLSAKDASGGLGWQASSPHSPAVSSDGGFRESSEPSEQESLCEHDKRIQALVYDLAGPIVMPEDVEARKARNALALQLLVEEEGNATCADCGAEGERETSCLARDVLTWRFRSEMGFLEHRHLHLHQVQRHPSRLGDARFQGPLSRARWSVPFCLLCQIFR